MKAPREDDFITNSDESKVVPDENPEPLEGTKTDEPDTNTTQPDTNENEDSTATKNTAG